MWPFKKKVIVPTVTMRKVVTGMSEATDYFVTITAPDDYTNLIAHVLGAIDSLENGIEIENENGS